MALSIQGHPQTFCVCSSSKIYTSADTLAVFEDFSCSSLGATVVIEEVSVVAYCSWELILFGSGTTVFITVPIAVAASAVLAVTNLITSKAGPKVYLVLARFPLFTYKITIIYNNNTKFLKSYGVNGVRLLVG